MSRAGRLNELTMKKKDLQAIRKSHIYELRDKLFIGQKIKVVSSAVFGDTSSGVSRKFDGKIKYIHTYHVVAENKNWRTSFTYVELLQPKTKVYLNGW